MTFSSFSLFAFTSSLLALLSDKNTNAYWTTIFNTNKKPLVVPRVSAGPIDISAIGCGTWSWGNRLLYNYDTSQDEEIYRAYQLLRDSGVTLFDTADSYGTLDLNGRAEILLGNFERRYIQQNPTKFITRNNTNKSILQQQQVATKFAPYPWRVFPSSMVHAAKDSLRRLQQDRLTIAQLHWSTAKYQPFQEQALWEGIAQVYESGLCDAVGVSNYGPVQLRKIHQFFSERQPSSLSSSATRPSNKVPLATVQIQYSLMTYKDSMTQDITSTCDDLNIRLISYSPLCLGLLTNKYTLDNLPPTGNPRRQLFRELLPEAKPLLMTLKAMGDELGKSSSMVAINWAITKGTVPIFGARTASQVEDNLASIGWTLSKDRMDALDKEALKLKKPMIQNIFQTK